MKSIKFFVLVIGLALSGSSVLAEESSELSPSVGFDDQQSLFVFSDRDCVRLNLLFDAMCQRSPEIQFFIKKLDPSHESSVPEVANGLLAVSSGTYREITNSREFWNQVEARSIGSPPQIDRKAQQFASEVHRKFPTAQKLTVVELLMVRNMFRTQCELLTREYRQYCKFAFPPESLNEPSASEWRNQAAAARQSLCDISGADAVAEAEKSLKSEKETSVPDDTGKNDFSNSKSD